MTSTINTSTGFYDLEKAYSVAKEMNKYDEMDWAYKVVDCKNGLGRIDVYDEDKVIVEKGFMF